MTADPATQGPMRTGRISPPGWTGSLKGVRWRCCTRRWAPLAAAYEAALAVLKAQGRGAGRGAAPAA
jgi:hypothetical protein